MKLHTLKPNEGSRKVSKRVGRGHGSGTGKTSGRGHGGQNSRSGGGVRPGFEGGQNPIIRRLPKRGFTNINRKEFAIINLDTLNTLFEDGAEVTPAVLKENKIVKQQLSGIKVLGQGKLEKKLVVTHKFSKSAKAAIEAAGGSVEEL